jgi:hypothetical protein
VLKVIKKSINHFLIACLLALTACATPSEKFAEVAKASNLIGLSLNAGRFNHQFYLNDQALHDVHTEALHVYLDGDGSPWEQQRWIADDPTSRNPIILELMRQDKKSAIFLGRPCYHGFNTSSGCHSKYWTSHRYSRDVVNSMVIALKDWLKKKPYQHIVLIGFSGGGTLALLIAPEVPGVNTVVTVAANLDVESWSTYHHFLPLSGSLNPAKLLQNPNLNQIHLAGLEDTVVPAHLIKTFADKQANAKFLAYPHFDHHCCWVNEWPTILSLF